jgi:ATP-dependent Clp protease ATP-binding subunit ClpA
LSAHFRVRIEDEALPAAVELSARYLSIDCPQPLKAVGLLTRACAARSGGTLDEEGACAVLETLLGRTEEVVTWARLAERLPELEADLLELLPGQEEAVRALVRGLREVL